MNYLKSVVTMASLFAAATFTHAATGVFGSYIGFNPNGNGNEWYGTEQWGAITIQDMNGANLGAFELSDTLQISAFQVQTFKSDGGDVTGIELQYRVYEENSTPGSFNVVGGGFLSDAPFSSAAGNSASGGGDQNWGVAPTATLGNLLAGISNPGTYNVEVFFRAFTNEGDRFSNNGGANYIASFSVVPEPTTYALIFGGVVLVLATWIRRRR